MSASLGSEVSRRVMVLADAKMIAKQQGPGGMLGESQSLFIGFIPRMLRATPFERHVGHPDYRETTARNAISRTTGRPTNGTKWLLPASSNECKGGRGMTCLLYTSDAADEMD